MAGPYVAVEKSSGHVLSSPSDLREPETGRIAISLWSWVPDPQENRGHHFGSRGQAKDVIRAIGKDLSDVTFRKAA